MTRIANSYAGLYLKNRFFAIKKADSDTIMQERLIVPNGLGTIPFHIQRVKPGWLL